MSSSERTNCPKCGGAKTFTRTYNNGVVLFNCYRVSCRYSGAQSYTMSAQELRSVRCTVATKEFRLPPYMIYGVTSEDALEWLYKYPLVSLEYEQGRLKLYQDPKENRICIPLVNADGIMVNLGGRTWIAGTYPKFKIYNRGTVVPPFIYGKGKTMVIVEDFISAISVGTNYDTVGYCILGTSIDMQYHTKFINSVNPDTIMVALDKDALYKASMIKRSLSFIFSDVKLLPLRQDIKDSMPTELDNYRKD